MSERELRDEVETLSGEVRDLRREKEALAARAVDEVLQPLRTRVGTLRAQRDALRAQVDAMEAQVDGLERERSRLRSQLSDDRSEIARRTPPEPPALPAPEPEGRSMIEFILGVSFVLVVLMLEYCA